MGQRVQLGLLLAGLTHRAMAKAVFKGIWKIDLSKSINPTQFIVFSCALMATLLAPTMADPQTAPISPESGSAVPPGYSTTLTGGTHDFDYLLGGWKTSQRRLKARGVSRTDWEDAPSNHHCATAYLDGMAIADESRFPNDAPAGLFLFFFEPGKRQWSLRWVNRKTGEMDPELVGGFDGTRGEFYGEDQDNGRAINVRVTWTLLDHDHARWEQAFSYDHRTWETNWVSDFTRTDPAGVCKSSIPPGKNNE